VFQKYRFTQLAVKSIQILGIIARGLSNLHCTRVSRFPGFKTFFGPYRDDGTVIDAKLSDIGGSFNFGSFRYGFHVSSTFTF
jgi:hypothetical protein